jgi:hypothetical protein
MSAHKHTRYFAILLSVVLDGQTQAADSPVEQCPGAAAWRRSHPNLADTSDPKSSGNTVISDPALLNDLKLRVESDQAARRKWLAERKNQHLSRSVDAIDMANRAWLRRLISEKGFPTAAQVGNDGVHLAWVLLQHADQDPKLQSEQLPVLEQRFSAGELPANDLARITDRVLVANRKPQRYGTQFDWFAEEFQLPESSRMAEIDSERSHIGLMSLADYVCTIHTAREKLK